MPGRHRPMSTRSTSAPTRVALTATVAALAVQPFVAQAAQGAVTVKPKSTATLPAAMDVLPSYQDQRSCDPASKPGVEAYVQMVLKTYRQGRNGGIARGCGIGATSEHKEGRAFDWMLNANVPAEKAAGDALTQWLTGRDERGVVGGNARRLGVMYVIWNRRIWSTYRLGDGWRPYSGSSTHTDHVHTSFTWDGALRRTSWWDGSATTDDDKGPCRVYAGQPAPVYTVRRVSSCRSSLPAAPRSAYSIVWPGQSGSSVKVAQDRLGLAEDGVFGAGTRTRLMGWQRTTKVPVTGVLDKPTWVKLVPGSTTTTPTTPTPTKPATPPTPSVPAPSDATLARTTTLTPFKTTVLRTGSRGDAVKALQRALALTADGAFGPKTAAGVAAFQQAKKLTATGVVDAATWSALEQAAYPLLPYRATVIRRGSSGSAVVALQRALKLTADGAFGSLTQAAVQTAQTAARRPVTGVVDVRTWIAIEQRAYPLGRSLVPAVVPTRPTTPPPPATPAKPPARPSTPSADVVAKQTSVSAYKKTVLRTGSRGTAVRALQRALGMSTVDGSFGPLTAKTVKAFQKSRHLTPTGVVGPGTWAQVERVAHPLVAYRTTVLRVGSRGKAVVALQRALRITADGAFGTKTKLAVKKAQARGHVAQTGTVATLTWVAIEKQAYPLGRKRW